MCNPCRDVAQLYNMRLHSGDMAHIRDIAPVIAGASFDLASFLHFATTLVREPANFDD
jgi:hypothetical protein